MIAMDARVTELARPSMAGFANVAEPFVASVVADPLRTAVICGGEERSYADLNAEANRIARLLVRNGVRPGDKVAYLLPNCSTLIAVYYAVQKIGAIAVPVNFRSIAPELSYLLTAADAAVLFFARQRADVVDAVRGHLPLLRLQVCVDGETSWAQDLRIVSADLPDDEPEPFRDASAISRIQFTGGSTGAPKGAERTHRADLVEFEGTYGSNWLYADDAKVVLIQCPLEHHGGHAWFASALSIGSTLVLCSSFEPDAILADIERYRVSYMILLPPTTYVRLMADPTIADRDLSSVRLVQSSAGGTSPEIVSDIYRWFPNAIMNYGWGQTESGLGSSIVLTRELAEQRLPRIKSVGRAMPLIDLKVVDEAGAEVPVGVVGECIARSEAVMRGYYGQPDLTAAAFTADGWLRTGDLMVRDADGYLYLKGRRRELIKSGGENVFIGEVEGTIREHPSVLDAMVFGRPDPVLGEAVAAVVELRPGRSLGLDELQSFCRERLASFKKPRSLTILDSIDRDYSGKIRRDEVIRRSREQQARQASTSAHPGLADVVVRVPAAVEVYRVVLPLRPPLANTTNAYLVRGSDGWLIVDPGPTNDEARGTMLRAFDELGIDPAEVEVFLSHGHTDHAGLVPTCLPQGRSVVLSAQTRQHLLDLGRADHSARVCEQLLAGGYDAREVATYESLRRRAFAAEVAELPATAVSDGQQLTLAGLRSRVLATPGHTTGHACLHLPDAGLLFTGDHVLFHLPPGLFSEAEDFDLLGTYLDGLARVGALGVDAALPGHGEPRDGAALAERCRDLVAHQQRKLDSLAALIAEHPGLTAAGLTQAVGARVPATWADLPAGRRWSIACTTLARLRHLVAGGAVETTTGPDGLTRYLSRP